MNIEINEAELHAFLDGELDELRSRRVALSIGADPVLRALSEGYRADRDWPRRIYAPLIEEPLPARFLAPFAARSTPLRPAWHWTAGLGGLAAAAAIMLVVALGSGGEPTDGLLAEAIAVRDGTVAAELQMAATAPAASRDALVADTLASGVVIPDLAREGYTLADLGVYPDRARGRAVQLNYRNVEGRRLTVYLRHPTGAERYEILPERDGKRVCIWESQELSAVMVGEMSEEEMLRPAYLAYHALNL